MATLRGRHHRMTQKMPSLAYLGQMHQLTICTRVGHKEWKLFPE